MVTELQKAWLAGFIDGEGSISIRRDKRCVGSIPVYDAFLSISGTDENCLKYVYALIGGSFRSNKPRNPKYRMVYEVRFVGSNKVFEVINLVYPYLIIKRKNAELALELISFKRSHKIKGIRLTSQDLEYLDDLFIRITSLNIKKGIHTKNGPINRIHYCSECNKPLPEDSLKLMHKECLDKKNDRLFGSEYRRLYYLKTGT